MAEFTKLIRKNDVVPGKLTSVYVPAAGANVVVAVVDGGYFAFKDECPHMSARLSNGGLDGKVVTCPEHSSKFDVTTGKPLAVADSPLETFEVRVEGDDVYVKV